MTIELAEAIVGGAGVYLAIGLVVGLFFGWRGAALVDHSASGASAWFRLVILPGAALLWPVMLLRLLIGGKINSPEQTP